MDAKITRSRLGNFLSYEWIKMLVALVAVVGALCIFFTTIATRPRDDQQYELYCYTGLSLGSRATEFDDILEEDVFSYDMLDVLAEAFDSMNAYGSAVYAARRATGQGEAMFVSSERYTETDAEGNETEKDRLTDFLLENLSDEGLESESIPQLIGLRGYMQDCEKYLGGVFGDWRQNDVPDDAAVREIFLARNGKDKRFRSKQKIEEGVALERERLMDLREDYLFVSSLIEQGVYTFTPFTSDMGRTYEVALNLDGLPRLHEFVYYMQEQEDGTSVRVSAGIHLVLFRNASDLRYESISLLRWLYEEFGA